MNPQLDPKLIIPPLSSGQYKGQNGKIGVVGGSIEYTGAPYYAGIASLKTGADLCHVFCVPEAAIPIKCYSPELIVHPFLGKATVDKILAVLPRLDSLVVGPGLGRDPETLSTAKDIISHAKTLDLPIVLDGDALFLVAQEPAIINGYTNAVLTPNMMEYARLCVALELIDNLDVAAAAAISPKVLATKLGNLTILKKGAIDTISDGHVVVSEDSQGCARRCGGQGDVLAGSVGTFLAWASLNLKNNSWVPQNRQVLAALGGSMLVRKSARHAYKHHYRAMTTPDLINYIYESFCQFN